MSNETVIADRMQQFLDTKVHQDMLRLLTRVAVEFIDYINPLNEKVIPVDTANLHDSTGVGVYCNGVLKRFVPNKRASEPRTEIYPDGLTKRPLVWGRNILQEALSKGASRYGTGYWIVIFSAMPYAPLHEERYFPGLKIELNQIINSIR